MQHAMVLQNVRVLHRIDVDATPPLVESESKRRGISLGAPITRNRRFARKTVHRQGRDEHEDVVIGLLGDVLRSTARRRAVERDAVEVILVRLAEAPNEIVESHFFQTFTSFHRHLHR